MKKFLLSAAVVATLSLTILTGVSSAQTQPAARNTAPHKVGLIDMAHVFKNYSKFTALRDELKEQIAQSDGQAKQMAEKIKALQSQLKSGQLKEGSPGYVAKERELIQATSDFEVFRKGAQRDFLRKESQIYKTVYMEVVDSVQKYAEYYNYTLVMRFSRDELEDDAEPQEVLQRMNKQVVFHRGEDDITLSVLDYLNRKYTQTAGKPAATSPR